MSSPPLAILLFLLPCLLTLAKAQQPDSNTIPVGSVITATNSNPAAASWPSPSRRFAFGFYAVGKKFAIGIWFFTNNTVIWTSFRDRELLPLGSQLKLTEDGLQIPSSGGDIPICNISKNAAKLASASMRDSGDFVILDVSNNIIWETFDTPTDTLMGGQLLRVGQSLVSSASSTDHTSGRFQLVMQLDGNLVMYPVNAPENGAHAYWSSHTDGDGYTSYLLNPDGNFLPIRDPNVTHNSTSSLPETYFLRIEPDGILRAYSTDKNSTLPILQIPNFIDKCQVKGTCGMNSYCNFTSLGNFTDFNPDQTECICLPGYVYTDPSRKYLGCWRNFSMGQCFPIKENNISYSISRLANVSWIDDPYNHTEGGTEKDCHDSCLDNCICYAALFLNQRCSMQRHPLLYAMRSDDATVAFLKIGSGEPQLPPLARMAPAQRVPSTSTLLWSVALASVLILALVAASYFVYITRGPSYQKLCRSMETGLAGGMAPRSFTHRQLVEATSGFTNTIGKGTFSTVFKGEIPLGKEEVLIIAVKRLEKLTPAGESGFRTEMRAVGRAHHRNVVRLLGFCHEGPKWLLVYEFMSPGSLASLIFTPDARPSWVERVHIAMDVARGLLYLHEGCDTAIIHSDIKPENVLVGEDGKAKIADLGLAKVLQPRQSKTYTGPRGTMLYIAPEWEKNAHEPVTTKVDVYSFGVLLLELITCRKHLQTEGLDGCHFLHEWAYKCLKEPPLERLVPEGEKVDRDELERMVMVALWCTQKAPEQRKSMKEVVQMLGGKKSIPMPPPIMLFNLPQPLPS